MTEITQTRECGAIATQADIFEALVAGFLKGSDLQSSLASRLADVAQSNARALLTINRDVAQMALEAIAKPDPMAIATLTPRALQLSMREGAACMAGSLEVSFSIGMALISAGLDLSKGKTGSS